MLRPYGSIPFRLLQGLHDLRDLDLGLADLAAAEVEEHGGAAQLLGEAVDVDLLALDPLEDAFELFHRRAEAQGRFARFVLSFGHHSSTRLLKSPPATRVVTRSPDRTWSGCRTRCPAASRVRLKPRSRVRSGASCWQRRS